MKAKRLPSGSWRVQVFSHYKIVEGKKKRVYKSFTSRDKTRGGKLEAEEKALKWLLTKESRTDGISIADACESYLRSKDGVLSPSTMTAYRSMLTHHFDEIGSVSIGDITKTQVQMWVSQLASTHSPKTVANIYGFFRSVYHTYTDRDLRIKLPQSKKPDLHTPTDAEIKALLAHVEGKEIELAILLAAFCSLRRGEICALKRSDFKDGMVHVCRSMVKTSGGWEVKTPKTKESDRYIPVPKKIMEKVSGEGNLFDLTPDILSNRFKRAVRFAHLPHFRFHDLRHYYASTAHYLGMPDAYILKNGGWSSDSVMKRVYREALSDKQKIENEKMEKHLNGMM